MPPFGHQVNFATTNTTPSPAPQFKVTEPSKSSAKSDAPPKAPDPSTFTIDPILIRALRNRPQLREDFLKAIKEDRESANGH